MKKIYIVLTYTGTILSRIIKGYTRAEFSHVSISLDEELTQIYSFGRLNAYNPFIGGFVHEQIDKGTFKRFKNTKSKVYSLEITDEQYDIIRATINEFEKSKKEYKFNICGLFAAGFNIRIKRKKSLYCAEFVKHVLEISKVKTDLPEIIKPEHFKDINELKLIYSGKLKNYTSAKWNVTESLKNLLVYKGKEGIIWRKKANYLK